MSRSALALVLAAACAHPQPPPTGPEPPAVTPAIARVWHGRVPRERAEAYTAYLGEELARLRTYPGNLGYELWREDDGAEVRVAVVSYWATDAALRAYAGEDLGTARSWDRDPEFLARPELPVRNYRVVAQELVR